MLKETNVVRDLIFTIDSLKLRGEASPELSVMRSKALATLRMLGKVNYILSMEREAIIEALVGNPLKVDIYGDANLRDVESYLMDLKLKIRLIEKKLLK